MVALADARANP